MSDNKKLPSGITQRSDGTFMGRFQVKGERHTVYGKTLKEVRDRMEKMRYEMQHGLYCKPQDLTIKTWYDIWMETYKKSNLKPSTCRRYSNVFRLYIEPKIGTMKLEEVQPQMLQRLINDAHDKGQSKALTTIMYAILKGMFTQAMKNQLILHNPVDAVTLPKYKKQSQEDKRVLTLEEERIFLKYAEGSVYYPFFKIALETGMRVNEVCGLEWSDIDFEKKEIHVSGTLYYERGKGRYKVAPKTESSDRRIPMLPDVEAILKDCRKQQLENRSILKEAYKEEPFIPNVAITYPEGGALWDTGIRVEIKKIVKKINDDGTPFEDFTPHSLRHTFATRCAEQGMSLQVLKKILGHSSLAMTSDLYSHVLPNTKQEEMRKLVNLV